MPHTLRPARGWGAPKGQSGAKTPCLPKGGPDIAVFSVSRPRDLAGKRSAILLQVGDVEVNPGPVRWVCEICANTVRRTQTSVRCNTQQGSHWIHIRCAGITRQQYTDSYQCPQYTTNTNNHNQPTLTTGTSTPKTSSPTNKQTFTTRQTQHSTNQRNSKHSTYYK